MPLNIHKEHFQGLVNKNKELRQILHAASKAKINGDWCVIEAVPLDEEMVYCYNEETDAQYAIRFRDIDFDNLKTILKEGYV